MTRNTKIEWADHTFNAWIGCSAISPGCKNCYAAAWAKRYGYDFEVRSHTKTWGDPVRWNKQEFFECQGCGRRGTHADFPFGYDEGECDCWKTIEPVRQRVFCASLSDVFDNKAPPSWRTDLWTLFESTPNLDKLVLTKRIGNVLDMVPARWLEPGGWPEHVWIGATVVDQEEADRDIPKLLAVPAAKRFLSIEPMLGAVDVFSSMTGELLHTSGNDYNPGSIDWIICGGESSADARPMHPDWARSVRDQCAAAAVPFLFKQWGEWSPRVNSLYSKTRPKHTYVFKDGLISDYIGKKAAGRLLNGVEHNGFPT
jgi:protein gp37